MGKVGLWDSIMFRNTFTDLTMYFFLYIVFSYFYSVNSLTEISVNKSTTVSPLILNKATIAPVISQSLNETHAVLNTSTEGSTIETRKEVLPDFNGTLVKLMNKLPVIGSNCKTTNDCEPQKHSVCLNGICQCETDFVATPDNKTCLLKAKTLGDECSDNVQCDSIYEVRGLVVCASFRCVCSANAVLIDNKCHRRTFLGKSCKRDDECASIEYSYCYQDICACDPDFFPDDSGTQCFPSSNGTSNMTNINCKSSSLICKVLGEHAYCSNDTCVCYPGYHINQNLCVKEKSLGEYCESNSDCEVDMKPKEKSGVRECKKNKCSCIKGYKAIMEHNICSGSSVLNQSLILILSSLFVLLK